MSTHLNPCDIPHIVDMIAQPLLFKDLLSCILVSRAWHDALISILWLDLVTYRSHKPKSLIWNYVHYFHTPESHQVLARHARHIRAVTCQGPDILPILLTSGCTHLVEINYLTRRSQPQRGLDLLASLVALCPNLRAVAVENLFYRSSETASDLIDFVTLLDSCPSVTCLYLEGNLHPRSLKKPLLEILERRLARVDTENVASLSFRDRLELTRAKRGPPKAMTHGDTGNKKRGAVTFGEQQYRWPGRESPLTEKVPNYNCNRQLEDESLGRWEFERRQIVLGGGALAVLATNESSALEVCLPTLFWSDFYGDEQETLLESILKRFPVLRRLSSGDNDDIANRLARTLPWGYLPHLREIDLQGASELRLEEFMDDPRVVEQELSTVSLWSIYSPPEVGPSMPFSLADKYRHRHFLLDALTNLELETKVLHMTHLLTILERFPNLQRLLAPTVVIIGTTEPETVLPWATRSLEELHLGIYLQGHESDMCRDVPKNTPKHVAFQSLACAERIAPHFMAQVGQQTQLRELALLFCRSRKCGTSPFLRLDLHPTPGLGQLSRLRQLESFRVSGLMHEVGKDEIRWMKQCWPRLRSIELPVFDCRGGATMLAFPVGCEAHLPEEYTKWFPNLQVRIPWDTYLCVVCEDWDCGGVSVPVCR